MFIILFFRPPVILQIHIRNMLVSKFQGLDLEVGGKFHNKFGFSVFPGCGIEIKFFRLVVF
jgi:hypothetical protein